MSASSSGPLTPDSSSMKLFEPFQRRKIGSIRDNTKLFKILQQFESACQEEFEELSQKVKGRCASTESAPCSFTSKSSVEEFFKSNSTAKNKSLLNSVASQLSNQVRRHSESEVAERGSESRCNVNFWKSNSAPTHHNTKNVSSPMDLKRLKNSVNSDTKYKSPLAHRKRNNNYATAKENSSTSARKSLAAADGSYSRLRFLSAKLCKSTNTAVNSADTEKVSQVTVEVSPTKSCENVSKISACVRSKDENTLPPPPIPKRGLSLPVTQIMQMPQVETPKKKISSPTSSQTPPSPRNVIKQNSVKKAIQLYEGLTSTNIKTHRGRRGSNYPKVVLRKDSTANESPDHSVKKSISRVCSKRNSFRLPKNVNSNKDETKKVSKNSKAEDISECRHSKEDSGIGFSDTEDNRGSQAIYQTLGGVTFTGDQYDTYDRLNRIHDMVNRIHKGQSSTCAACRAIPSGSLQLPQASSPSILHVKCNELSPHHHPPCICFSCRHSVFSCSQNASSSKSALDLSLDTLSLADSKESLYYNVCCLNGPTCEGWRQSRRRPVCEQNGRVCVVNCDVERKGGDPQLYEKLFEWNTLRPHNVQVKQSPKQLCGDSCDSDEGWVDITDSEDEKMMSIHDNSLVSSEVIDASSTFMKELLTKKDSETLSVQNHSYDLEQTSGFYSKLGGDSMSRAASSEHLYETIADLEAQNVSNDNTSINDLQMKNDVSADNDPDSGEWSTESSSSPTPVEPSARGTAEEKPSTSPESPASRFTVASDLEYQDSGSKKTFIKSVLGKKTANPKKRRMSHFFVPWLVSNSEYGVSRSPKSSIKKQNSRTVKVDNSATKASKTFTKNKRSQSIPSCATGTKLTSTKIFSSTEILDRCKSDMKELDANIQNYPESRVSLSVSSIDSVSQSRGSLASSTYVRADQLHSAPALRSRPSLPIDTATDVSVERIFRRSSSGESMHSYIVFRPIKEEDVPLYQFYERNIKERVTLCRSPDSLSPVLFSAAIDIGPSHDCSGHHKASILRPQLSVVEQLSPDAKDIKMLWCELPEVKESGILERISAQELKLQEAAFEFIQSQASYIRSLKVLYEYFICVPEFSDVQSSYCVLSKHEHDVLFSDITGIKEVSERLMTELTTRWSDGILIPDICDIIYRHATLPSFSIYIKYCSNRVYQERTLKELEETRLCFLEVLRKLESNPACQGLSLESFLFLPMQHIARLPLLLDSIFSWLSPDSPSFNICKMALEAVHKTFMQCNEGARKMERLEEMFILNKQMEFKECKAIPLISASRWLLKRGELIKLDFDKKTFGRSSRCVRVPLYIFLFNDLVVITKRKSDDSYLVLDYCLRDKVQATAVDAKDLQQPDLVPSNCRYLLNLTLFSNHQSNSVDMILNCTLLSERTRWLEAIHPVSQKKTSEVWEYDCPQVQCVRSYIAQQPDELSLQESDVVTIQRKMNDGWYEGRRLRDGLQGWFPASYTMDIPCSRARASNLRQCYRLLMLSHKHESAS